MTDFKDLDAAAEANLQYNELIRYHAYKSELVTDGEVDIEAVLRGYIWACIESYGE